MRDVIRAFNARLSSGLRPEVRHLYADGDTVVALFDARSIARDGKPYEENGLGARGDTWATDRRHES